MKHASAETITKIEALIDRIRSFSGLTEKKPGIYYYKSSAFLHFHEDGDQIYADIKRVSAKFERLPVTTKTQQDHLLRIIRDLVR